MPAHFAQALVGLAVTFYASFAAAQDAAGTATPPPASSPVTALVPFVLMFAVLYFLLIRPQKKKVDEHKKLLSELRRGDKIVTSGGIIGTITKLEGEDIAVVEIAPEVKVRVAKTAISSVLTRTEPADGKAAND